MCDCSDCFSTQLEQSMGADDKGQHSAGHQRVATACVAGGVTAGDILSFHAVSATVWRTPNSVKCE